MIDMVLSIAYGNLSNTKHYPEYKLENPMPDTIQCEIR